MARYYDTLFWSIFNDIIFGSIINDTLFVSIIYDMIFGSIISDMLFGSIINDMMFGSSTNDTFLGVLSMTRYLGVLSREYLLARCRKTKFSTIYPQMKNFNMAIPILMHFCSFVLNWGVASRIMPHVIQRNVT